MAITFRFGADLRQLQAKSRQAGAVVERTGRTVTESSAKSAAASRRASELIERGAEGAAAALRDAGRAADAETRALKANDRSKRRAAQASEALKRAVRGYAAIAAGAALYGTLRFGQAQLRSADSTGKASTATGINTETLQRWGHAAQLGGTDLDNLVKGQRRLTRVIHDSGSGLAEATDSLDALGLTYAELVGLSPERQFERVTDRLAEVDNASTKAALAQEIFGRSGTALIPVIGTEAGTLAKLGRTLADGAILTEEQVRASERFNDAATQLAATLRGAAVQGFGALVGPGATFVEWLSRSNDSLDVTETRIATLAQIVGEQLAGSLREANDLLEEFERLGLRADATQREAIDTARLSAQFQGDHNVEVERANELAVLAIENDLRRTTSAARLSGRLTAQERLLATLHATEQLRNAELVFGNNSMQVASARHREFTDALGVTVERLGHVVLAEDAARTASAQRSASLADEARAHRSFDSDVAASAARLAEASAVAQAAFAAEQASAEVWAQVVHDAYDGVALSSDSLTDRIVAEANARVRAFQGEAEAAAQYAAIARAAWQFADVGSTGGPVAVQNLFAAEIAAIGRNVIAGRGGSGGIAARSGTAAAGGAAGGSDSGAEGETAAERDARLRRDREQQLRRELGFQFGQLRRADDEGSAIQLSNRVLALIGELESGGFLDRFEGTELRQREGDFWSQWDARAERERDQRFRDEQRLQDIDRGDRETEREAAAREESERLGDIERVTAEAARDAERRLRTDLSIDFRQLGRESSLGGAADERSRIIGTIEQLDLGGFLGHREREQLERRLADALERLVAATETNNDNADRDRIDSSGPGAVPCAPLPTERAVMGIAVVPTPKQAV